MKAETAHILIKAMDTLAWSDVGNRGLCSRIDAALKELEHQGQITDGQKGVARAEFFRQCSEIVGLDNVREYRYWIMPEGETIKGGKLTQDQVAKARDHFINDLIHYSMLQEGSPTGKARNNVLRMLAARLQTIIKK